MTTGKIVSIGVDPGIHGGIFACDEGRNILCCKDTPTKKSSRGTEYDAVAMYETISELVTLYPLFHVTIERQQVMRSRSGEKQGAVSAFSTGFGYGLWLGIFAACGIASYNDVPPQTWTSMMFRGMVGTGKARSIALAMRVFPGIELVPKGCRAPRDGRADAACLAYYGLRLAMARRK